MKKLYSIIFLLLGLMLVTGCGGEGKPGLKSDSEKENVEIKEKDTSKKENTHVCTMEEKDEKSSSKNKYTIKEKDGNVTYIEYEAEAKYDDSKVINQAYEWYSEMVSEINKIDGMKMKASKPDKYTIKSNLTIDYDKLDYEALVDLMGEDSDDAMYQKDLTYKEFKSTLDGYTCD